MFKSAGALLPRSRNHGDRVLMGFLKRLAEGRRLFRTYLWGKPRLPLAGERGGGRDPPEISPKKRPARETRSKRKFIDTLLKPTRRMDANTFERYPAVCVSFCKIR